MLNVDKLDHNVSIYCISIYPGNITKELINTMNNTVDLSCVDKRK